MGSAVLAVSNSCHRPWRLKRSNIGAIRVTVFFFWGGGLLIIIIVSCTPRQSDMTPNPIHSPINPNGLLMALVFLPTPKINPKTEPRNFRV